MRLIDQILKEAEVDLQLNETQFFRLKSKIISRGQLNYASHPRVMQSPSSVISVPKTLITQIKDVILGRDRTLKERQHLSNLRETLNACIESGETDF